MLVFGGVYYVPYIELTAVLFRSAGGEQHDMATTVLHIGWRLQHYYHNYHNFSSTT